MTSIFSVILYAMSTGATFGVLMGVTFGAIILFITTRFFVLKYQVKNPLRSLNIGWLNRHFAKRDAKKLAANPVNNTQSAGPVLATASADGATVNQESSLNVVDQTATKTSTKKTTVNKNLHHTKKPAVNLKKRSGTKTRSKTSK